MIRFALAGNPSCYAGLECVYTKTRSKGFRFCAVESSGEPFVEPWKPACGDVLLNEVLTWPAKGGVDYVELYNASDSTVSLDCLQIGTGKNKVALPARPLLSGGYALLATDTKWVADTYSHHDSGAFVTMPKMPAFAADSGEVWLYDNDGNVLDSLFYNGMMHNQRLETTQGVALERLQGTAEWASAGMAYQYGSPGLPNPMVVIGLENQSAGIRLLSTQVSPNGDGVDDRLGISLSFAQDVYVHLTVCSPYGQTLSTLIDGAAANGCQYVWWDAVDARGRAVAPGIYLVVSEVEGDGFHQRRKIPFVVVP